MFLLVKLFKTGTHELETINKGKMITQHECHIFLHIIVNYIDIHLTFFTILFVYVLFLTISPISCIIK